MITEDYVSFETAKLLKEKGFDGIVKSYYGETGLEGYMLGMRTTNNSQLESYFYARPTLQMAMKWLRKRYNLEIYPYHDNSSIYSSKPPFKWWYEIIKWPNTVAEYESGKDEEFDTYEDVCEAAIKYCLENLI